MKPSRPLLPAFRFFLAFLISNLAFSQDVPERSVSDSPSPTTSSIPARPRHGAVSPQLLRELLDIHERSGVGGQLAISVYSVRHQRYEARWNDSVPFVPASTLKLVVTAAALDAIPEDDAPHTTLEVAGRLRGRTLRGELRILGGGDPNISDRFYESALDPLRAWADSLKAAGIDTVRGRVTASDAYFSGPRRPEAWAARHFGTWYGAEVSALSFNDNCIGVAVRPGARAGARAEVTVTPDVGYLMVENRTQTVARGGNRVSATLAVRDGRTAVVLTGKIGRNAGGGSWLMPVRNPPEYFRAGFLTALREQGVVFIPDDGVPRDPKGKEVTLLRSLRFSAAPLASMVDEINQRSQNLHAEMLLRHLGRKAKSEGSARAGIAAEYAFLARLGIDTAAFVLHDASGLSHLNRAQARAMALLLARMARSPQAGDYVSSLAQPGLDGATGKRMREYTGSGLVRYKTGTLNGVSALSGYAFADDGDTLAVALILNGKQGAGSELLDAMLMRIALWYNKQRPALAQAYTLLDSPGAPPPGAEHYAARLRFFSKALLGRPYFLGPTGEGRHGDADTLPMADLSRMDCVTYIENVVALARAREVSGFLPALLPIRYHGDSIAYAFRNHYFVGEWIANNPADFKVPPLPGDTVVLKTLARRKLLAAKNVPGVDGPDIDARLRYVPYERALALAKNWRATGLGKGEKGFYGVAFMTSLAGLDATHTGFVDVESGKPVLRHAGQLKGEVTEQDFAEYLESRRGKCAGVLFFEFMPPVLPARDG